MNWEIHNDHAQGADEEDPEEPEDDGYVYEYEDVYDGTEYE